MYGHHHLNTTNIDAQKKFYADTLGGGVARIGSGDRQQEIIKFSNVLIFSRPMQAPTGGSIGQSIISASRSKNLEAFTKKLEAQGIRQLGIAIAFIKDPWGTNY